MNLEMSQSTRISHGPTTAALVAQPLGPEYLHPFDASRPIDSGRDTARETHVAPRRAGAVAALAGRPRVVTGHSPDFTDLVDEWGRQSFPASELVTGRDRRARDEHRVRSTTSAPGLCTNGHAGDSRAAEHAYEVSALAVLTRKRLVTGAFAPSGAFIDTSAMSNVV